MNFKRNRFLALTGAIGRREIKMLSPKRWDWIRVVQALSKEGQRM